MTDTIIRVAETMTASSWAMFLAGSIAGMAALTWWQARVLRNRNRR